MVTFVSCEFYLKKKEIIEKMRRVLYTSLLWI